MTGSEIRQIREDLELTQAQFASLLGVHAITVSRWESKSQPLAPTPFQTGLIERFAVAVPRRRRQDDIATLLVTAGAIAGLAFLLNLAIDPGPPSLPSSMQATQRRTRRRYPYDRSNRRRTRSEEHE